MKIKILDLFAGVGGLSYGVRGLGDVIMANDMDKNCKTTYDLNHDIPLTLSKIEDLEIDSIPDFDILLAGFPCQPFSIAGLREGFNDQKGRGNVFYDIMNIVREKSPSYILLENVKNLVTHDNGNSFKVIQRELTNEGYHLKWKVLNSKDYGIPQNRERIFIVGFKDVEQYNNFEFPSPIPLAKNVADFLEDQVDSKYYYHGKSIYPHLENIVKPGKIYQWRRKYVRENKQNLCPTLTANMGTGGHNVPIIHDLIGIRKITPRECFNLQGFSKWFKLPNLSDGVLYKQAGNSVTVNVVEAIAWQIIISL